MYFQEMVKVRAMDDQMVMLAEILQRLKSLEDRMATVERKCIMKSQKSFTLEENYAEPNKSGKHHKAFTSQTEHTAPILPSLLSIFPVSPFSFGSRHFFRLQRVSSTPFGSPREFYRGIRRSIDMEA